jgi:hypothetical protein
MAALAVGAVIVAVLLLTGNDSGPTGSGGPTAVKVDGPDADDTHDDTIQLSQQAQDILQQLERDPAAADFGPGLRGNDPTRANVLKGPLAAEEWPGCKTAFVRAFSQRTDTIKALALHYTVSGNVPGWADVDGLTAFSDNLQNQASWHFNVDQEGHCAYTVPIRAKAWTIGNLNSQTINIEVVARGTENAYLSSAAFNRILAIAKRIRAIWHVPIRLGAVDGNCHVTKTGIITHWMGGACSGGHIDIRPFSIEGTVSQLAKAARSAPPPAVVSTCAKVARYRRTHTHPNRWQRRRLDRVHAAGWGCGHEGRPVQRP